MIPPSLVRPIATGLPTPPSPFPPILSTVPDLESEQPESGDHNIIVNSRES